MKIKYKKDISYTDKFTKFENVWVSKLDYTKNVFNNLKTFLEEKYPSVRVTPNSDFNEFYLTKVSLEFLDPSEEAEFIAFSSMLEMDIS